MVKWCKQCILPIPANILRIIFVQFVEIKKQYGYLAKIKNIKKLCKN